MVIAEPLPAELIDSLMHARAVELSAVGLRQQRFAIAATGAIMLAGVHAGWTIVDMAKVLGITRGTASKRVAAARARYDGAAPGLAVPLSDRKEHADLALTQMETPLEQRQWLTIGEAAEFAGVGRSSIHNWLRAGLLPNTQRGKRHLFLRADLLRVDRAEKYNRGANRAALLKRIRESSA